VTADRVGGDSHVSRDFVGIHFFKNRKEHCCTLRFRELADAKMDFAASDLVEL
jgi:hypothetical protein